MVGMDRGGRDLSIGGLMTRSVDFCDWVAFLCWGRHFDGIFSPDQWPNFVTYDVAGVAIG